MSKETVNKVLGEFGKQIGLDDLRLDDNGYAALAFDDVVVNLEFDADLERLLMSAYLGEPQGDRLKTYELLLDANFCWQGTAGGTLSLERETGGIVLFQQLPARALDLRALEAALETFVNTADAWTLQIAQAAEAAAAPAADHPAVGDNRHIIRG
jgi:Tir chaperone protein (CesT) family